MKGLTHSQHLIYAQESNVKVMNCLSSNCWYTLHFFLNLFNARSNYTFLYTLSKLVFTLNWIFLNTIFLYSFLLHTQFIFIIITISLFHYTAIAAYNRKGHKYFAQNCTPILHVTIKNTKKKEKKTRWTRKHITSIFCKYRVRVPTVWKQWGYGIPIGLGCLFTVTFPIKLKIFRKLWCFVLIFFSLNDLFLLGWALLSRLYRLNATATYIIHPHYVHTPICSSQPFNPRKDTMSKICPRVASN